VGWGGWALGGFGPGAVHTHLAAGPPPPHAPFPCLSPSSACIHPTDMGALLPCARYGATPAGVAAAIVAANGTGLRVALIEASPRIGGMATAGGIGLRDTDNFDAMFNNGSIALKWATLNGAAYGVPYVLQVQCRPLQTCGVCVCCVRVCVWGGGGGCGCMARCRL
jgi:hypothetical protein